MFVNTTNLTDDNIEIIINYTKQNKTTWILECTMIFFSYYIAKEPLNFWRKIIGSK